MEADAASGLRSAAVSRSLDQRMQWMLRCVQSHPQVAEDRLAIRSLHELFHRNIELLEELLADRTKFRHLFVWQEEETEPLEVEIPTMDYSDEEDTSDDEGPRLARNRKPPRFFLDIDGLNQFTSPLKLGLSYFVRMRDGFVPISSTSDTHVIAAQCEEYLRFGQLRKEPLSDVMAVIAGTTVIRAQDLKAAPHAAYAESKLASHIALLRSYAGSIDPTAKTIEYEINVPKVKFLFTVPFKPKKDTSDVERAELESMFAQWTASVEKLLDEIHGQSFTDDAKEVTTSIQAEFGWWAERTARMAAFKRLLAMPAVQRAITCMREVDEEAADGFMRKCQLIDEAFEEAQDNTKFLDAIKRHVETCVNEVNFDVIRATIKKVVKSLRNAWMLSKSYNTDDKLIGLINRITAILLYRVRHYLRLEDMSDAHGIWAKANSSLRLLQDWEDTFLEARREIELTGREARWEFPVQEIFAPTKHVKQICRDVMETATVLNRVYACYSPDLEAATFQVDVIAEARAKTNEMVASFSALQIDVFVEATSHHWNNHLSWFRREIIFLGVWSVNAVTKIFDNLRWSQRAAEAVVLMIKSDHDEVIGKAILSNMPRIVEKLKAEIAESAREFDSQKECPPIAENLPPVSGAICWAEAIQKSFDATLQSMTQLQAAHLLQEDERRLWESATALYAKFDEDLTAYRKKQYQSWCCRVSDILTRNLTRTLLLAEQRETAVADDDNADQVRVVDRTQRKDRPESKHRQPQDSATPRVMKYTVNFTSDLSDTLAEVKHLENLGFAVPEVARNMSVQECKLKRIADDLGRMVERFHAAIDLLDEAEVDVMLPDIERVQRAISPGHVRLSWNNLGIEEYLSAANVAISKLHSKIQEVNLVRSQLQECINEVSNANLLRNDITLEDLPTFAQFHSSLLRRIDFEYDSVLTRTELMTPALVKIEELLFGTRSLRAGFMRNYYSCWEKRLYDAVVNVVLVNLDAYVEMLSEKGPCYVINAVLQSNDISLDPDSANVIEGIMDVAKRIILGTKRFVRVYRGSWIKVREIHVSGSTVQPLPTIHDDVICLRPVKARVEALQKSISGVMRRVHTYLLEWKSFRNLWLYSKELTCQKFIATVPTCVGFDEKLLFYYNCHRVLTAKPDEKRFSSSRLNLRPLKAAILSHVDEWVSTLGHLLEDTARIRLEVTLQKVEDLLQNLRPMTVLSQLQETVQLIFEIGRLSLDVELSHNDIEERCRTLEMYGIPSDKEILRAAGRLPLKWKELFNLSKEIEYQLRRLKEKERLCLEKRVVRYLEKLQQLLHLFMTEGPYGREMSLEEAFKTIERFRAKVDAIEDDGAHLNNKQKIFQTPITKFLTMKELKKELSNNAQILDIFNAYQEKLSELGALTLSSFASVLGPDPIGDLRDEVIHLQETFGENHVIVCKLLARITVTQDCLRLLVTLNKAALSERHWRYLSETHIGVKRSIASYSSSSFFLADFLSLDYETLSALVTKIMRLVEQEAVIERNLCDIMTRWDDYKFSFERWVSRADVARVAIIITDLSLYLRTLEEDVYRLDEMLDNENSTHFRTQLQSQKGTLHLVLHVLSQWKDVQVDCLMLARALLPETASATHHDFERQFTRYGKMMNDVVKKPVVKACCLSKDIRTSLAAFSDAFEATRISCADIVALKKSVFPRLNFLSFNEILVILGGWMDNEEEFQSAVTKVLGKGIVAIACEKDAASGLPHAVAIRNSCGETLHLLSRVLFSGKSELFLNELVEEMRNSIWRLLRANLTEAKSFTDFTAANYCDDTAVEQVAIAGFEAAWTSEVERILLEQGIQHAEGYKALHAHLVNLLWSLIASMTTSVAATATSVDTQRRMRNLVHLVMGKKALCHDFLLHDVNDRSDFLWTSSLRMEWVGARQCLRVLQGAASLTYGYEFLSVGRLPVVTRSLQRTQFALASAVAECKAGVLLRGPAFSGKSTAVADLCLRLGFFHAVATLRPDSTIADVRALLHDICEANCWGLVTGLDKLRPTVLSAMTTLLQEVAKAQGMKLKEFSLCGLNTRLGPATLVAFECRDDSLDRTALSKIPFSLRAQLRMVLLPRPDLNELLLAHLAMALPHLREPKAVCASTASLLNFAVTTSRTHNSQPSSIGMVREVLAALEGFLRADAPSDSEASIVVLSRAVRASLERILSRECFEVVEAVMESHFQQWLPASAIQQQAAPVTPMDVLREHVEASKWIGVIVPDRHVDYRSLVEACATSLGSRVVIEEIPCNGYPLGELVGRSSAAGKWQHGILTRLLAPRAAATKTRLVCIADFPHDDEVADILCGIQESGRVIMPDSKVSMPVPNVMFVFVARNGQSVASSLLNRISLLHLGANGENWSTAFPPSDAGSQDLVNALKSLLASLEAAAPWTRMVRHDQARNKWQFATVLKAIAKDSQVSVNEVVYSFCWSFALEGLLGCEKTAEDVSDKLTATLASDQIFESVHLVPDCSLMRQYWDATTQSWQRCASMAEALFHFCRTMLVAGSSLLFNGLREHGRLVRRICAKATGQAPETFFSVASSSDVIKLAGPRGADRQMRVALVEDIRGMGGVQQTFLDDAVRFGCVYSKGEKKVLEETCLVAFADQATEIDLSHFVRINISNVVNRDFAFSMLAADDKVACIIWNIRLDVEAFFGPKSSVKALLGICSTAHIIDFITEGSRVWKDTSDWKETIVRFFYLPLFDSSDRIEMGKILDRHTVTRGADTSSPRLAVVSSLEKMSTNLLALIGVAGAGKMHALISACNDLKRPLVMREDATSLAQEEHLLPGAVVCMRLIEAGDRQAIVRSMTQLAGVHKSVTFVLLLHVEKQFGEEEQQLIELIRSSFAVVGVPEWSEADLSTCCLVKGLSSEVMAWLTSIHSSVFRLCQAQRAAVSPNFAHFQLCQKVCARGIATAGAKLQKKSELLAHIFDSLSRFRDEAAAQKRSLGQLEEMVAAAKEQFRSAAATKMERELVLESIKQRMSFKTLEIKDVDKQLAGIQSELEQLHSRSYLKLDSARAQLEKLTPEEIEEFVVSVPERPELLPLCSLLLLLIDRVVTEEVAATFSTCFRNAAWRQQMSRDFDPQSLPKQVGSFLSEQLQRFDAIQTRDGTGTDSTIVNVLVEFCEGVAAAHSARDDFIDYRIRVQESEIMLSRANSELDDLSQQLEATAEAIESVKAESKSKQAELASLVAKADNIRLGLDRMEAIEVAFEKQTSRWRDEMQLCVHQKESVRAKETLAAAVHVYMPLLRQSLRRLCYDSLQALVQDSSASRASIGDEAIHGMCDPWSQDNILATGDLPGWKEDSSTERICIVYDPHDIAKLHLNGRRKLKSFSVRNKNDLGFVKSYFADSGGVADELVLYMPRADYGCLSLLSTAAKNCKLKIFCVVSSLPNGFALPGSMFFYNLELSETECRRMFFFYLDRTSEEAEVATSASPATTSPSPELLEKKLQNMALHLSDGQSKTINAADIEELIRELREKEQHSEPAPDGVVEKKVGEKRRSRRLLVAAAFLAANTKLLANLGRCQISIPRFADRIRDAKDRDDDIADEFLFSPIVYQYSERHAFMLKVLTALYEEVEEETLTEEAVRDVLVALQDASGDDRERGKKPDWISEDTWRRLGAMKAPEVASAITHLIQGAGSEADLKDLPVGNVSHLLFNIAIDPSRSDELAERYLEQFHKRTVGFWPRSDALSLSSILTCSSATTPILLLTHSACQDPSLEVDKLAKSKGVTGSKLKFHALGEGQLATAEALLTTAAVRGQWLVLQNLEMDPEVVDICARFLNAKADTFHEDFRLWFTLTHPDILADVFFQKCIVVHCEDQRELLAVAEPAEPNLVGALSTSMALLQKRWLRLNNLGCLMWRSSTEIPINCILDDIRLNLHAHVSIGRLSGPKEISRMVTWLTEHVLAPYVIDPEDKNDIEQDVTETLHVLVEFETRGRSLGCHHLLAPRVFTRVAPTLLARAAGDLLRVARPESGGNAEALRSEVESALKTIWQSVRRNNQAASSGGHPAISLVHRMALVEVADQLSRALRVAPDCRLTVQVSAMLGRAVGLAGSSHGIVNLGWLDGGAARLYLQTVTSAKGPQNDHDVVVAMDDGDSSSRAHSDWAMVGVRVRGLHLAGATWANNGKGIVLDPQAQDMQDLGTVVLMPRPRAEISSFKYCTLPVFYFEGEGMPPLRVGALRVLSPTVDVIVQRNARLIIKSESQQQAVE